MSSSSPTRPSQFSASQQQSRQKRSPSIIEEQDHEKVTISTTTATSATSQDGSQTSPPAHGPAVRSSQKGTKKNRRFAREPISKTRNDVRMAIHQRAVKGLTTRDVNPSFAPSLPYVQPLMFQPPQQQHYGRQSFSMISPQNQLPVPFVPQPFNYQALHQQMQEQQQQQQFQNNLMLQLMQAGMGIVPTTPSPTVPGMYSNSMMPNNNYLYYQQISPSPDSSAGFFSPPSHQSMLSTPVQKNNFSVSTSQEEISADNTPRIRASLSASFENNKKRPLAVKVSGISHNATTSNEYLDSPATQIDKMIANMSEPILSSSAQKQQSESQQPKSKLDKALLRGPLKSISTSNEADTNDFLGTLDTSMSPTTEWILNGVPWQNQQQSHDGKRPNLGAEKFSIPETPTRGLF